MKKKDRKWVQKKKMINECTNEGERPKVSTKEEKDKRVYKWRRKTKSEYKRRKR